MENNKKEKIFKIIFGGTVAILVMLFIIVIAFMYFFNDQRNANITISDQTLASDNIFRVYVVSGKIIDIQNRIIFLETPVFDPEKKGWDMDKKEVRKLAINNQTSFLKNISEWDEKKKEYKANVETIGFDDLKIDDRIDANYSEDLAEIKDFSPKTITVLLK